MENQYLAWGLTLLGIAVFLVVIELFVPSGGIIAIVAALTAIAGIISLFVHDVVWGLIGLVSVLIATPIMVFGGLRVWATTRIGRRMLGEESEDVLARRQEVETRRRDEIASLVGAQGEAVTDLHPIGVVRIDGRRYDAQAEVRLIDAGDKIVVTHADGFQIKVRRTGEDRG